jgi:basic membrane protein A
LIASGLDVGREETGLTVEETSDAAEIEAWAAAGTPLILMDAPYVMDQENLAGKYPETTFVSLECQDAYDDVMSNLRCIPLANEQVGFLAGAVAALTTATGRVGVVLGVEIPILRAFQAGFEQGVRHVDPAVEIDAVYLTNVNAYPDFSGFSSFTLCEAAARRMYREGADVVFQGAGSSGLGVFEAAAFHSEVEGSQVWAIGVDIDQSTFLESDPQLEHYPENVERWKRHILTSVVKRLDFGVIGVLRDFADGELGPIQTGSVANGAIDYVTTGGHIHHLIPKLEAIKAMIGSGEIAIEPEPETRAPYFIDFINRAD